MPMDLNFPTNGTLQKLLNYLALIIIVGFVSFIIADRLSVGEQVAQNTLRSISNEESLDRFVTDREFQGELRRVREQLAEMNTRSRRVEEKIDVLLTGGRR